MILFAVVGRESIGAMFMGGIIPGLMLAVFYCAYIFIRSQLNPNIGPPLPPEERASWGREIGIVESGNPSHADNHRCPGVDLYWISYSY